MHNLAILFLISLFSIHATASSPIGPSFDCANASTKVEKDICSSPLLSFLDLYLADMYKASIEKYPERMEELKNTQQHWLKAARNNLCLKGDFSWAAYSDTYGIDGISTTDLEKCYVLRIAEMDPQVCNSKKLCNKYKRLLTRFHDIPELMSSVGSGDKDFLIEYGKVFNSSQPQNPLKKHILDEHADNLLNDLFSKCFTGRPYIYYNYENFFIIRDDGHTTCGGNSPDSASYERLCVQNNKVFAVNSYWQCKNKTTARSILEALKPIIQNENFPKSIDSFRDYASQAYPRSTPETHLISILAEYPFLLYNHPSLYSKEAMLWINNNHPLIISAIGKYTPEALTILRDAKFMYSAITKERDWQNKLIDIVDKHKRRLLGFKVDDEHLMNTNVVGTIYSLHDVYVLTWARIYKYGDISKTLETIDKLTLALEELANKATENPH